MKKLMMMTLSFVFSMPLWAQPAGPPPGGPKMKEKIKEARIEFMKKKLALTAEEEKAFLPVYEKMIDEMDSLRKKYKQEIDMEDLDLTFMTDEECEKVVEDVIAFKQAELTLMKNYTEKFKKILPIKKVAMIFKAEYEFRKELVKRIQDRKRKGKR